MKRLPPDAVQAKIRSALVEEVAKNGIGATSVGAVAKRAGVSAGTIYLHFENKEDLLQKVYLTIKNEFHALMMTSAEIGPVKAMIRQMWFDTFDFVSRHPTDFLFIEFAGAAQVLSTEQSRQTAKHQDDIHALLQRGIDQGVLVEMPVATIAALLVAPAMFLARSHALKGTIADPNDIAQAFDRVWLSIAASN